MDRTNGTADAPPDPPGGGAGPWPSVADFAVPAVTAAAQLGLSPLLVRTHETTPTMAGWKWAVLTVCALAACAALIWRRRAPVPVLVATVLIGSAGLLLIGRTDTLVGGVADAIALYSLAVHRGRRAAVTGGLLVWAAAFLAYLPAREDLADVFLSEVFDFFFYLVIIALGQLRRQHKARRRELAAQLAAAERERRAAAEAERERLARDLHDVAGHHLSAVVVHSGAAARVGDPDLSRQALSAAADTGRDVLTALTRLVDVVGPEGDDGGLDALLPPLCQGLTRLGVPVSLAFEGRARRVRPQVVTAAYRIVQESLTNAMRYAPGAAVAVEVCYASGAVRVSVVNRVPAEDAPVPSLGGGRGITGMRERAEALRGTLTAGPAPDGGWEVAAVLPTAPAGARRGMGWQEVVDGVVVAVCAVLPSLLAFVPADSVLKDWSLGGAVLLSLALAARVAPLWWRRRAPYRVLAVLVVVDCAAALAAGPAMPELISLLVLGCPAGMFAVYAVACYSPRGTATWPAPLLAAVPWGVEFTVLLLTEPQRDGSGVRGIILFGMGAGLAFGTLLLLPFWAWGRTVARGRRRWEASALETMAARTGAAVMAERHRVAIGLRGTVLEHTARLVRTAEAGLDGEAGNADTALTEVAEHARAALVDMRALLDAMRDR
ncbi:sensor histidine kinase [Actinomadura hibisca]|uniref:sensor histidine kinase n=1 Tax=Actinomadura hibisca TaxID=68565 RepID=UPI00083089F9|nr:sensor histidine kinase [Actinomadura hibisca]